MEDFSGRSRPQRGQSKPIVPTCMRCSSASARPNDDVNTTSIMRATETLDMVLEYLRRVESVIWNRKFFACNTEDNDDRNHLYGFGSEKMEIGDRVCILFGCSVPVVVRDSKDREFFTPVGEGYVHGKMDGEALASMDDNELNKREKSLRIQ
ncbi:hypothetical protein P152DRAFT_74017 [Eremomyces bilateralis CBS 781.70]|uniref:Uncharacterized protein n=1 Tax=Eremomyces bilateralis CBS 781.70 TaxID=1392243 RepID=A0A6G1FYU5_9PEZI|nr:uncharacterized protein P152DRAFT_74017 [Eremomyces bilateralis CBS 781.70]KAF1811017.1 hypothetical protein P152DRAFT_74017 [Eremomyces bilateralis CBS 781.70]